MKIVQANDLHRGDVIVESGTAKMYRFVVTERIEACDRNHVHVRVRGSRAGGWCYDAGQPVQVEVNRG